MHFLKLFLFILLGFECEHHWFLGHHPELEPPLFYPTAQSCYTADYRPPYGSIFFVCVQRSEKEQEGCRKSNRDGENLQTTPSEKQEACLLAVLRGYPSSKKTCHTLKPNVASCEKRSSCFPSCTVCNLCVFLLFVLCAVVTASHQSPCAVSVKPN